MSVRFRRTFTEAGKRRHYIVYSCIRLEIGMYFGGCGAGDDQCVICTKLIEKYVKERTMEMHLINICFSMIINLVVLHHYHIRYMVQFSIY